MGIELNNNNSSSSHQAHRKPHAESDESKMKSLGKFSSDSPQALHEFFGIPARDSESYVKENRYLRGTIQVSQVIINKPDAESMNVASEGISNSSSQIEKMAYIEQEAARHGYDRVAVAGMIGNFMKESGENLDTNPRPNRVVEDLGHEYRGLAQWYASRKDDLIAFAKEQGKDVNDFTLQVAFVFKELEEDSINGAKKLKQARTPEQAARVFCKYYERPMAKYADVPKRELYARTAYTALNQYEKTNKPEPQPTTDMSGMPTDDMEINREIMEGKIEAVQGNQD